MLVTLLLQRGLVAAPASILAIFGVTFVCAIGLVLLTVWICRRRGWVARPRQDRWHSGTPCLFGGVPLWGSFVLVALAVVPLNDARAWRIIAASSFMFLLGLIDDIYGLRPSIKLLAQVAAASYLVSSGLVYPLRDEPLLNFLVSVLWIVGLTNAINLLDNMDGLSAGIALISAFYLAVFYFHTGLTQFVIVLVIFGGSTAGFLLFNFKPARIFMGDTGSLFIGFFLGSASLLQVTHLSGVSAFIFVPVLVLALPVFDTFFVSVTRRLRGQPISQGGTDHCSHRLVKLGLDERSAVVLLYALSAASGAIALFLRRIAQPYAIGLIGTWFLFLFVFGIHLFKSTHEHDSHSHELVSFTRRLFSRDILAVVLDPAALSLSYYLAYLLRFGSGADSEMGAFLKSWPLVLGIKFLVLLAFGMYRRSWWRGSRLDYYRLLQATIIGELLGVLALTGVSRFSGYSRLVFAVDAVLSFAVLAAIRSSFFYFRDLVHALRHHEVADRRVFLVGTSELTQAALKYLSLHNIRCVGLIDNNGGGDLGRRVWGTEVIGRIDDLRHLAELHGVGEVVIPESESLPVCENDFHAACSRAKVRVVKFGLYPAKPEPPRVFLERNPDMTANTRDRNLTS